MNKRSLRATLRATASFKFALGVGLGIAVNAPAALANPAGGSVSTGSATITTPAAGQTQINQSSQGVVINWGSFNIGSTETTKFVQPNASAIAVNRIGGNSASQIQGSLLANGQIVLINPNGVAFGSHATVNVGSLIATTTGASDSDALAGRFTTNGNQNATISNQGNISASGFVALVAPHVSNSGTVTATLGDVSLGGANAFTVDLNGDGLVSFALPGTVTSGASVTNTGSLVGKNVMLSARAAQSAATGVINTTGVVQATGVSLIGGQIVLDGGSGVVNIGGTLKANGNTGGGITASGAAVGLTSATLDVSGTLGGGAIHLGGGGVASIDSHSTLNASATANGNGGVITIDATKNTIAGKALARGGATSGNGGMIETGGTTLTLTGFTADTSAPHGTTGIWIANAPSWSLGGGIATAVQTNLATSNVFLASTSSTGDITLQANITWSSANSLTLDAMRNVVLPQHAITDNGAGGVSLIAGNDISVANSAAILGSAPISLLAGHDIVVANAAHITSSSPIALDAGHDIKVSNQAVIKATGAATIDLVAAHDITLKDQMMFIGADAVTLSSGDNIALANQVLISTSGPGALTLDAYQNISGVDQAKVSATGHGGIILHAGDENLAPPAAAASTFATAALAPAATSAASGTVTLNGSVQIAATGGGSIALYYNPTTGGPPPNFGNFVSVSGGGSFFAYQLIHTLADLQAISDNLSGSYALGNDIDASATVAWNSGAGFVPLGNASTPFTGNFDGQNFTVSNLTIDLPTSTDVGLFGFISTTGSVGNLAVLGANVTGGNNVGILAGENDGTVVHDASSGMVRGVDFTDDTLNGLSVGGLVGLNTGLINFSASGANVTGFEDVGGLVGMDLSNGITASAITNSFATGDVSAVEDANEIAAAENVTGAAAGFAGGLLGDSGPDPIGLPANLAVTIANDYATGDVTGDEQVGGLIGIINNGTVSNVYATGNVTGLASGVYDLQIGGLIGLMSNRAATPVVLSDAWASGNVSGAADVGGLVGFERAADLITNAHASGSVSGDQPGSTNIGGLVGRSFGNITDSYSTGPVSGDFNVGGLVGDFGYETNAAPNPAFFNMAGTINNSWTSSTVSGISEGAVIGSIRTGASGLGIATPTVSDVYFNTDVSGGLPAFGGGDLSAASAIGLNTPQMESTSSFSFASDFGALGSGKTWVIVDQDGSLNNAGGAAGGTMPMLLSEYSTNVVNAHQLQLMALDPTATYTLAGNINAGGTAGGDVWGTAGFIPVGGNNAGAYFTGTLEGNGNTIDGLFINDSTVVVQYVGPTAPGYPGVEGYGLVGLFGGIGAGGLVENLNLMNANVSGGDMMGAGALVDVLFGTVENVTSSGTVHTGNGLVTIVGTGTNHNATAGGLVGAVFTTGLIDNSSSSVNVTGGNASHDGGLAGAMVYGGTITNSHASGNVSTGNSISGTFQNVTGTGGLVGIIFDLVGQIGTASLIDDSYATGNVTGELTGPGPINVGGLVGLAGGGGLIENSYATGNVSDGMGHFINNQNIFFNDVGGFIGGLYIGANNLSATVTNSYATGNVQGGSFSFVGGFVGYNEGTITDTYATGTVSGSAPAFFGFLGGFAGGNGAGGSISDSYTNSAVLSYPGTQGGFVALANGGTYSGDYWNLTTGINNPSQGAGNIANQSGITGLTTSQMSTASSFSFAGDFGTLGSGATWVIVDQDGSLNNAGGAAGGTTPMLLNEYSTTITNAHQLQLMALDPSATYTLAVNINASATAGGDVWGAAGFIPVGGNNAGAYFTGTFEGNGNSINGLFINDTTMVVQYFGPTAAQLGNTVNYPGVENYGEVGLFGGIGVGGAVENLAITNANVTGGQLMGVGILAGEAEGTITNVSTSGNVAVGGGTTTPVEAGTDYNSAAGGLVGGLFDVGVIQDSSSSATVTGGDWAEAGGLVGGAVFGGTILNSHASGTVSTGNSIDGTYSHISGAGGLVGVVYDVVGAIGSQTVIDNSYATGNVSAAPSLAPQAAGGFIGLAGGGGLIENSYATGNVSIGPGTYINSTTINLSSAGGFIGFTFDLAGQTPTITRSYARGTVTGQQFTALGGFVGQNYAGTITDSYSTGTVGSSGPGFSFLGGFAGFQGAEGNISNSYTVSAVLPYPGPQGGFLGYNIGGSLSGDYWNLTTGIANPSQGVSNVANAAGVTGLTTSQMETASSFSFAGDFGTLGSGATWVIIDQDGSLNNAGGAAGGTMPMLLSEYSTNIVNAHQLQLMALDPSANYTLGNNINAAGSAGGDVWGSAGFIPVAGNNSGASFTGALEGNGYTINGLTINDGTPVMQYFGVTAPGFSGVENFGEVGLFGAIGASGTVDDLSLTNAAVSGGQMTAVGILAGSSEGAVTNVSTSGTAQTGNGTVTSAGVVYASAGGLIGGLFDTGTVQDSSSSATVSGGNGSNDGGLIGGAVFGGTVTNSFATGSVSTGNSLDGTYTYVTTAGGLIGITYDLPTLGSPTIIDHSYATGNVSGGSGPVEVGGFIGFTFGGSLIENSYATGNITVGNGHFVSPSVQYFSFGGGFVGNITQGAGQTATITGSYATGNVTGGFFTILGGFDGYNQGTIADSYSMGSVSVSGPPVFAIMGGFAGLNDAGASITSSYTTSAVSAYPGPQGGFVGINNGSLGGDYWDLTTGIGNAAQGAGNIANVSGATGLTTVQLQSGLPGGLTDGLWAINASINSGLPYLIALVP